MANDPLTSRPLEPNGHPGTVIRAVEDGEQAYVRIKGDPEGFEWGPCPWMPRGDATPQADDPCLLIEDSQGGHWIAVWWPA
jgi:hypothetical protein